MRVFFLSLFICLLLLTGITPAWAQAPYAGGEFMGFTINIPRLNGWSWALPNDVPGTLFSHFQSKVPEWFPVSGQEFPVTVTEVSGGRLRISRGEYQLTFVKSGPKPASLYIRAFWVKPPASTKPEIMRLLGEARQNVLKDRVAQLADYKTAKDESHGSECLRIDARFNQKSTGSGDLIATRTFLCPNPDMPAYVVEVGYGERSGETGDLQALETELQSVLSSFRLRPLAGTLKEVPGSRVTAIPLGFFTGAIGVAPDAIWVASGHRSVHRIDPQTSRVVDSIEVDKSVTNIVALGNDLWLTTDHSQDLTTKNGDVLLKVDLRTRQISKVRLKEAQTLGFHLERKSVTLQGANWGLSGADGDLTRTTLASGRDQDEVFHVSGLGFSGGDDLVAGSGAVWVSSKKSGVVYRIQTEDAPSK